MRIFRFRRSQVLKVSRANADLLDRARRCNAKVRRLKYDDRPIFANPIGWYSPAAAAFFGTFREQRRLKSFNRASAAHSPSSNILTLLGLWISAKASRALRARSAKKNKFGLLLA